MTSVLRLYTLVLSLRTLMGESIILTYRNILLCMDASLIIWQIAFPVVYLFVAGYSYSVFLPEDTSINGIPYFLYLASGMALFQAFWVASIMGALVWEDKRDSMLLQLMVIMKSRSAYVVGYLLASFVLVLISVGIVFVIYPPLIYESQLFTDPLVSFGLMIYALIALTVLFGSVSFIISVKSNTIHRFTLLNSGFFVIVGFISSGLFPLKQEPFSDPLSSIFYLNPLTYVTDIFRSGIFSLPVDTLIRTEIIVLGILAISMLAITLRMVTKMDLL